MKQNHLERRRHDILTRKNLNQTYEIYITAELSSDYNPVYFQLNGWQENFTQQQK